MTVLDKTGLPILSILLFLPLVGALLLLLIPKENKGLLRGFSMMFSLLGAGVAASVLAVFDDTQTGLQLVEKLQWMPSLGISYSLGIDGISLLLVCLTSFLAPIVILSTFKAVEDGTKAFLFCLQLLQVGMLGAFLAEDLFLFYIFWELMLIPMYFLIGVFGGERRIYAAVKFFLYTLVGSLLMLVALLYVYFTYESQTGVATFDLATLYNVQLTSTEQLWLFAAFGLAFAVKVPMFPFHTWLPDAHVEAPTAGSVILAAVLLKMGTYGFIRFAFPLFPQAAVSFIPVIAVLAIIGIIYGALVALVQPDMKKLIAYSSVSHLGFVMLGIAAMTPAGVSGALLQMVNHGISTGLLFLLVGVIYERRHTRLISEYGGLAKQMPWYAVCFLIATLASIGLPGTNGFVGEFLVLLGTFTSDVMPTIFGSEHAAKWTAALAGLGVILGAVYMLWLVQRVFFGPLANEKNKNLKDLTGREVAVLLPLIVFVFVIGLFPNLLLKKAEPSIEAFINDVKTRSGYTAAMETCRETDNNSMTKSVASSETHEGKEVKNGAREHE